MRCGSSDKWFDDACRPICPALWVASRGPPASLSVSTLCNSYAIRRLPSRSIPPEAMTLRILMNNAG